jgi:carbon starvation protein
MHGAKFMWITGIPLVWLVVVCFAAGYEKIFSDQPRLGFLADATRLQNTLNAGTLAGSKIAEAQSQIFNNRLDAFVCGVFLILVATILIDSVRIWVGILSGTKSARVEEAPFVLSQLQPEEL